MIGMCPHFLGFLSILDAPAAKSTHKKIRIKKEKRKQS